MRHPAIKTIFNAWSGLKNGRSMPDRADIIPSAFGAGLPHIFLLEQDAGTHAETVRLRLAGSRLCAIFGDEMRNHAFLNLFSHAAETDAADMLAAVTEDGLPVIAGVSALFPSHLSIAGELLLLPLAHAAARNEIRILGAVALTGQRPTSLPASVGFDILSYRIVNERDAGRLLPEAMASDTLLPSSHALLRRSRFRLLDGGLR